MLTILVLALSRFQMQSAMYIIVHTHGTCCTRCTPESGLVCIRAICDKMVLASGKTASQTATPPASRASEDSMYIQNTLASAPTAGTRLWGWVFLHPLESQLTSDDLRWPTSCRVLVFVRPRPRSPDGDLSSTEPRYLPSQSVHFSPENPHVRYCVMFLHVILRCPTMGGTRHVGDDVLV